MYHQSYRVFPRVFIRCEYQHGTVYLGNAGAFLLVLGRI